MALPAIPTFDADATGRSLGARSDKRRVALVACADSSTQKSAARWLTSTGFEVVTAVGAAEALDQFGRYCRFDSLAVSAATARSSCSRT